MKHNFQGQVSKAECVRTKQNMCIFIRSIETLFSGLSGKQKYKIFIGVLIKKKLYPKTHISDSSHKTSWNRSFTPEVRGSNLKQAHCALYEANFKFKIKDQLQHSLMRISHLPRNVRVKKKITGSQSLVIPELYNLIQFKKYIYIFTKKKNVLELSKKEKTELKEAFQLGR